MITLKQIRPPGQFKPEGIGEPVIGVRILISPEPASPVFFPADNRIGTELLCRFLQARLEHAGVHVAELYAGFPFNRSYYEFTVSELALGGKVVKEGLEKLDLLRVSQIVWRDTREGVWRIWHTNTARVEVPSEEELATEREFFAARISALNKRQESQDESPGQ